MSVLPFPSILDDVKEKGLKRAVFEAADDVVERLTAGMNIQDIREAMRGDTPSRRPNPRLTPHADGFWLHMRPSYYHESVTGIYPTFRLGWLSVYFVFFETITGIFLMIFYTPSPEFAYANMLTILSNVPFGQFMRDLHRLGAEAMVLIVTLHMFRTFITGSYKKPRQFTWFTGVVLLLSTLFLSFSGYLLPWDQLALWAVTIGASMAEAFPPQIVGTNINLLLRGGPEIGANGLLRFYLLHVLLVPLLLYVFLGVHYYKVIIHGHSLVPREENIGEDTAKRVPLDRRVYYIPDIMTSEIMWFAVTTLVMIILVTFFWHAPLENHADTGVTPLGTTAPWYFLWIQGALKLGDKTFWGVIFPGIVFNFFMILPYVDIGPSRRYADRRFVLSIGMVIASMTVILSYMGLPEFGVKTSADAEILNLHLAPTERIGIIKPLPYDQLVVGYYTTAQFEVEDANDARAAVNVFNEEIAANGERDEIVADLGRNALPVNPSDVVFMTVPEDAPELHTALEEFHKLLETENAELANAWGTIIISQNQANLKRVDLIISWDEVVLEGGDPVLDENGNSIIVTDADGNPIRRYNARHLFINQDSQYFRVFGEE